MSDNFILLLGSNNSSDFFRLAQINLADGSLHFIQKVEFRNIRHLLVDSSNLSKFLVICRSRNGGYSVFVCKLVSGKIETGTQIIFDELNHSIYTYFNDQLLVFKANELEGNLSKASIIIQDLDAEKSRKTLKLKPLPSYVCHYYTGAQAWSGNYFFVSIQFRSANERGIALTNLQTCSWTILKFAINLSIYELSFDNRHDLLVYARENRSGNFYKLSMRKPEFLRNKAWVKLVTLFKKRQVSDPYEEARRYLPLNSDIRGPFAADQGDVE